MADPEKPIDPEELKRQEKKEKAQEWNKKHKGTGDPSGHASGKDERKRREGWHK